MILRLKEKNLIDVIDFFNRVEDKFEDTYITLNKERIFLKNNWSLIKKLLRTQEIYGIFEKDLKGIVIIYREKGFRPYLRILTENIDYTRDLIKYIFWNHLEAELFLKLKINNPLLDEFVKRIKTKTFTQYISKGKFYFKGLRGNEILLVKKAIKEYKKIIPKDDFYRDKEK